MLSTNFSFPIISEKQLLVLRVQNLDPNNASTEPIGKLRNIVLIRFKNMQIL